MKTLILFIFFIFISVVVVAQAPQGINYQGVAFGANGLPISKHKIGLRLSILDSTATGKILYQESQTPTTDTLGLFSIVIGTGTVLQGNFLTINWGTNNKYLKTEIDTTGGTNYVVMGITQFMSVPYALYANATKPTYQSLEYPDGFNNLTTVTIGKSSYTVPSGKNLYLSLGSIVINNVDTIWDLSFNSFAPAFSENQQLSSTDTTINSLGFLVDKTVNWITTDIVANPITVPPGNDFVVVFSVINPNSFQDTVSIGPNYLGAYITIDGQILGDTYGNMHDLILSSGHTISAHGNQGAKGQYIVNGYFRKQ